MDRRELLKIILGACAATLTPEGLSESAFTQSSGAHANSLQIGGTPAYEWLCMGEVKPAGWIKEQMLRDLHEGFAGSLDRLCREASSDIFVSNRNSAAMQNKGNELGVNWWNGETEGNWRAGYIMMAYLTEDLAAMQEADRYVKHILASQDADGYLGVFAPDMRYVHQGELWTQACLLRGLLAYWELTHKPEVYKAVRRAVDLTIRTYQSGGKSLPKGESHDLMIIDVLEQLYQVSGNPKYRDFALWFYDQWSKTESKWDATLPSLLDMSKGFTDHGVHTYENIRVPLFLAVATSRRDIQQAAQNAFVKVAHYSEPSGSGVSQELIGNLRPDPWHTEYEYCATKELQLTFESALQKTGRSEYGDRVELIWFNAAQGARLPNGSAISYLTSDNRLRCDGKAIDGKEPQKRNKFSPTHSDVAVCCNPNATQVAALFVRGMWMRDSEGSLVAMLYGPSTVSTLINGVAFQIEERTQYPFRPTVEFIIHPEKELQTTIHFRNPLWSPETRIQCDGAKIKREGEYWSVQKRWQAGDTVSLEFKREIQKVHAINGEVAVKYGALLFAEPVASTKLTIKRYSFKGFEDSYYQPRFEATATSLRSQALRPSTLTVGYPLHRSNSLHPFDTPLIELRGQLISSKDGPPHPITLIPLGNASLLRRLTFPDADALES